MEWYKRLKNRRIELELTQQELADLMGYKSKTTINKIEMGKNDIPQSKISEFCKILKISETELMGYPIEQMTLSEEEIELIKKYRKLKDFEKEQVKRYFDAKMFVMEFENTPQANIV